MSFLAGEWAEEHAPVADTYERIILLKLARHASDDGTTAYPSVASMARSAMCDTETVKRRLRAMRRRGLIGYGDQRHVAHFRADRRPKVYDLLIPVDWYSDQQLAKVNQQRTEHGLTPLNGEERPAIAPAPARIPRADRGTVNPSRSPKRTRDTTGALTEPPSVLGDNSHEGSVRALDGGSDSCDTGALTEPQIRPLESVQEKPVRPDAYATPTAKDVPVVKADADHRTDELPARNTNDATGGAARPAAALAGASPGNDNSNDAPSPQRLNEAAKQGGCVPGGDVSFGEALVATAEFQADWQRLDMRPGQRTQLARELDKALLRFDPAQVAGYLRMKTSKTRTVKWLLDAFRVYGDAIGDQPTSSQDTDDQQLLQHVTAAPTMDHAPVASASRQPAIMVNPSRQPASDTTKAEARAMVRAHLAGKHAA